jgi:hypothetical protein
VRGVRRQGEVEEDKNKKDDGNMEDYRTRRRKRMREKMKRAGTRKRK